MVTKEQLISDIILRVSKGKPADDLELEPSQVEFWINNVISDIVKSDIESSISKKQSIPDYYIKREDTKIINNDGKDSYITVSKPIYDLIGDMGVIRVLLSDGSIISKARIGLIDFIRRIEFSKPSEKNIVYIRDGKSKLILEGLPKPVENNFTVSVWYIPQLDLNCYDPDEVLPIPLDIVNIVLDEVEQIALRQISGEADLTNESIDNTTSNTVNG